MLACCQVDTPVVQAHRQVKQKAVAAGKVKIKKTGQRFALKHHVVAKQVAMHWSARQGGVC